MILTINQHDAEHYACHETRTKMTRAEVAEVERTAIRVIWSTAGFGTGNGFGQRQYEVVRELALRLSDGGRGLLTDETGTV